LLYALTGLTNSTPAQVLMFTDTPDDADIFTVFLSQNAINVFGATTALLF
jgi:hypothetical protein